MLVCSNCCLNIVSFQLAIIISFTMVCAIFLRLQIFLPLYLTLFFFPLFIYFSFYLLLAFAFYFWYLVYFSYFSFSFVSLLSYCRPSCSYTSTTDWRWVIFHTIHHQMGFFIPCHSCLWFRELKRKVILHDF